MWRLLIRTVKESTCLFKTADS